MEDKTKAWLSLFLFALSQFSLFILGLYLSLAAIIVLPLLKLPIDKNYDKTLTDFKSFLNQVTLSENEFNSRYYKDLIKVEYLSDSSICLSAVQNLAIEKSLLNRYLETIVETRQEVLNSKNLALFAYNLQLSEPVYDNLKSCYKRDLQDWVLSNTNRMYKGLDVLNKNMKLLEFQTKNRSTKQDTMVVNLTAKALDLVNMIHKYNFGMVPSRPRMGDDLGSFKWLSGWLAKTQFPALVLIVGLLGFGILGATVKTFFLIEEHKDKWFYSFNKSIITGFTASILVFLATMGGLIIYNGNTVDTNGYIVFFICFCGAMFSETIYEWAKNKFGALLTH